MKLFNNKKEAKQALDEEEQKNYELQIEKMRKLNKNLEREIDILKNEIHTESEKEDLEDQKELSDEEMKEIAFGDKK